MRCHDSRRSAVQPPTPGTEISPPRLWPFAAQMLFDAVLIALLVRGPETSCLEMAREINAEGSAQAGLSLAGLTPAPGPRPPTWRSCASHGAWVRLGPCWVCASSTTWSGRVAGGCGSKHRKEVFMGIRNRRQEVGDRLGTKTLDAQFLAEAREGLNCSPFEAQAVLDLVKEVFGPYFGAAPAEVQPGKVTLVALSAEEPAGKPLADCQKKTVCLTVHRGAQDDRLIQQEGPAAFRRSRIAAICQEALSQGALLTCEDLAYRIFFVTPRTITRDLKALGKDDPEVLIPLRSTIHDIGPVLSHRTQIVRLALQGLTTSEICLKLRHSAEAVANYLGTFTRCVQLEREGMDAGQIAFVLGRGRKLVECYLELLAECKSDKTMSYHLQELMRVGCCEWGKKGRQRRWDDGP